MTATALAPRRVLRWIAAPLLAFIALVAWAFASPVGAGPDDDYHLVSIWCAIDGSEQCEQGATPTTREVSFALREISCFAFDENRTAACQTPLLERGDVLVPTDRGNFAGEYPPIYHAMMHPFAGSDLQVSALVMRVLNAALFVALATALAALLPLARRPQLLWGWLITVVPLGIFLIPSNNPSGWALTGVGTAFLALLGWFETQGRRRWALGALYLVGVVMAAGARGDAAVYVVGATAVVLILTVERTREWALRAILPVAGILFAIVMFASAGQSGVAGGGFTGEGTSNLSIPSDLTGESVNQVALAAYNLLMLPFLWTGVWGTWALGWFDTSLPAIVPWAAVSAFVVVAFAGLGRLDVRKAISLGGVLLVLTALPVWVLTRGGNAVGENLQPRYLLPLIVLFAFLLLTVPPGRTQPQFTRVQTFTILGALALANLVALQINIRRYVTGAERQGLNLDAGAEWWWAGLPLGPTAVWVIGSLAFAGLLAVLWPQLRRHAAFPAVVQSPTR